MNQTRRFPTAYIATALRTQQRHPVFRSSAARVFAGLAVRRDPTAPTQRRLFHASSTSREENGFMSQLDPATLTEPMMKIGDLANHGLSTMLPTRIMEYCLEFAHVTTGLPWWATIALVTVGVRAALFPITVHSQRDLVKVNNAKPEIERLKRTLDSAQARGDTIQSIQKSNELATFYKSRGIRPFRAMVGNLTILPFMLFMFLALRDLARIPVAHMGSGGILWFVDLASADPYYVLPVISCIGMMGSMELQTRLNSSVASPPGMKIMMRCMGVLAIFFTYALPANVFVFWVTNNVCSIFQTLVLHNAAFRVWAKIPDTLKSTYVTKERSPTQDFIDKLMKKKKPQKFVVKHKYQKPPSEK
ncbi:hypothetical protein GGI23_003151 [Coemansia sp. RSA 2559]|nr:hypothetical protein GGI23_003151 [Coemansia sp. RSA 2559]